MTLQTTVPMHDRVRFGSYSSRKVDTPLRLDRKGTVERPVMIVLAHPDDEVFLSGTASLLNHRGIPVQFVYLTDGDAGRDVTTGGKAGKTLAASRRNEVHAALSKLGIRRPPIHLKFPDGQLPRHIDNLRERLKSLIQKSSPGLVLTFGPDGVTRHPDHVAAGKIADQALEQSGLDSGLYHVAVSERSLKVFRQAFGNPLPGGWSAMHALPDKDITDVVELPAEQVNQKLQAAACHASQFDDADQRGLSGYFRLNPREEFVCQRQ